MKWRGITDLVMSTLALGLPLVVIVLVYLLAKGCIPPPVPSDQEVRAVFSSNREVFEQLKAMIHEDRLDAVRLVDSSVAVNDVSWHLIDDRSSRISKKRADVYLSLLKKINASRIDKGWNRMHDRVAIYLYIPGGVHNSTTKTVLFSNTQPKPLLDSTDGMGGKIGYCHLADHWYIEFLRD